MPEAAIIRRIDAALARMSAEKMEPRAIYLTPADYASLARVKTKRWQKETGSSALIFPLSYEDVPIVNESLCARLSYDSAKGTAIVPVRQAKGKRASTIYSTHGVTVRVPSKAP